MLSALFSMLLILITHSIIFCVFFSLRNSITAAFLAANSAATLSAATDLTQNNSITAAFNTANLIQTYVTSANANITAAFAAAKVACLCSLLKLAGTVITTESALPTESS